MTRNDHRMSAKRRLMERSHASFVCPKGLSGRILISFNCLNQHLLNNVSMFFLFLFFVVCWFR